MHKILKLTKPSILKTKDEEFYKHFSHESNKLLSEIIPNIPYVGGKDNMFTIILEVNACFIALYKVMKKNGEILDNLIRIFCETTEKFFQRYPKFILKLIGWYMLSRRFIRKLTNLSNETHQMKYPGNWIFTVKKGNDEEYRWKTIYSQCAICNFWKAQELEEMLPYCCFFDIINSKYCNTGIQFESTIGEGSSLCIASVKKGRKVIIPEILKKYIKIY
jgi:hypothetical protein